MRLLFIRHGDPDYVNDTLTQQGRIEAKLLSDVIGDFGIDEVYVSPLGRAADTAEYSLKVLGKEAVTLEWLREFPAEFDPNVSEKARKAFETELQIDEATGLYRKRILWDVLPSYFGQHPELFDRNAFLDSELAKSSNLVEKYRFVSDSFDQFLEDYGYERDGDIFRVKEGNSKTIAFFCHFGITAVLLSRLWNVSPFVTLQSLAMAPTSVTEVVTEERQRSIATFRTLRIGDISHLTNAGVGPSFSARFCERFENEDERH